MIGLRILFKEKFTVIDEAKYLFLGFFFLSFLLDSLLG